MRDFEEQEDFEKWMVQAEAEVEIAVETEEHGGESGAFVAVDDREAGDSVPLEGAECTAYDGDGEREVEEENGNRVDVHETAGDGSEHGNGDNGNDDPDNRGNGFTSWASGDLGSFISLHYPGPRSTPFPTTTADRDNNEDHTGTPSGPYFVAASPPNPFLVNRDDSRRPENGGQLPRNGFRALYDAWVGNDNTSSSAIPIALEPANDNPASDNAEDDVASLVHSSPSYALGPLSPSPSPEDPFLFSLEDTDGPAAYNGVNAYTE
jgi:hypothetical protein